MAKFGPSGAADSFYSSGHTGTAQMPKWLSQFGLDLYEYSFGRGVRMSTNTAKELGELFQKENIELSVHAPYYINFASLDDEKILKSTEYIIQCLKILRYFNQKRCILHVGTLSGQTPKEAMDKVLRGMEHTLSVIYELGYDDMILCPETMGRQSQVGSVDEILQICNMDKMLYPCMDFGHINSREQGILKSSDDFARIIEKSFNVIGEEKTSNMHVHFSKIMYGDKGEIKHMNFVDTEWGPDFEQYAKVLVDFKLTPHIICESRGMQAEDAKFMKDYYLELRSKS